MEVSSEKQFEEIKLLKEKLQKLASQFDKELMNRDKKSQHHVKSIWEEL